MECYISFQAFNVMSEVHVELQVDSIVATVDAAFWNYEIWILNSCFAFLEINV